MAFDFSALFWIFLAIMVLQPLFTGRGMPCGEPRRGSASAAFQKFFAPLTAASLGTRAELQRFVARRRTWSTRAALVCLQPLKSDVNGHCHDRRLLGALLARPYHDVLPVNTRDVQDDGLMMLVVNDTPRIAHVRVTALQGPGFGGMANLFQPTNFSAFVVSPIRAGTWRNAHDR
jgi:hypothetical protein